MYIINPGIHCDAIKWILLILLGTIDVEIYSRGCSSGNVAVTRFMNSGHAGSLIDGRLLSNYAFTSVSCALSWEASLGGTRVSSTIETRNMVTTKEVEEAVWSNDLVSEVDVTHPVDVMFGGGQRYHWRIELIGYRNFCIKIIMSKKDVTVKKFIAV